MEETQVISLGRAEAWIIAGRRVHTFMLAIGGEIVARGFRDTLHGGGSDDTLRVCQRILDRGIVGSGIDGNLIN